MNVEPSNLEVGTTEKEPTDRFRKLDTRYRVWLYACEKWQPISCSDIPSKAVAVEEAESRTFSAKEAARYVRAFNMTTLRISPESGSKIWAVALPVAVFYRGDPRPGQRLFGAGA
ncbi:MAG: hypothetical protein JXM70_09395 [Pirellulales bacterium]|nr:hypothetical protein [Pirellulales bacterium]